MATFKKLTDPVSQLLDKVDVFLFDCDGVLWKGESLIDGIPEILEKLRKMDKKIYFVTNNSTSSRKDYKKKFEKLGIMNVQPEEIFSSSYAAAIYLEQINFNKKITKNGENGTTTSTKPKKAYVVGESGICDELNLIGIETIGGLDHADKVADFNNPNGFVDIDKDIGAVVVGYDRYINYYKLQYAQLCINELGAKFIATNLDSTTPGTKVQEWAGGGTMVGAVKGCTGLEPILVGKPNPLIIDFIVDKLQLQNKKDRICIVGDRLDTDILFGTQNGLQSLLVLSGVTTEENLKNQDPENIIIPDYYTNSINDFFT